MCHICISFGDELWRYLEGDYKCGGYIFDTDPEKRPSVVPTLYDLTPKELLALASFIDWSKDNGMPGVENFITCKCGVFHPSSLESWVQMSGFNT